jgi:hypothetical protein
MNDSFKMMILPKRPKREIIEMSYSVTDWGETLADICKVVPMNAVVAWDHYNDACFSWKEDESPEAYQERCRIYQNELKVYRAWAKENATAIAQHKDEKDKERMEQKIKDLKVNEFKQTISEAERKLEEIKMSDRISTTTACILGVLLAIGPYHL